MSFQKDVKVFMARVCTSSPGLCALESSCLPKYVYDDEEGANSVDHDAINEVARCKK